MKYSWLLIPDAWWSSIALFCFVGAGLCYIIGLKALALSLLGAALLIAFAAPLLQPLMDALVSTGVDLVSALFHALSWWAAALLVLMMVFAVARFLLSVLVGNNAADHTIGILVADMIRGGLRLLVIAPVRLAGAVIRLFRG